MTAAAKKRQTARLVARTEFRRDQRYPRAGSETGRAMTGRPSNQRSSSSANAAANRHAERAGKLLCDIQPFCQTEFTDQRLAARIEQDVSRFEIAMKNSLVVSVINASRHRCDELNRPPRRFAKRLPEIEQTSAGREFHA